MTVCEWCDSGNTAIYASPGIPLRVSFNGLPPKPCCEACLSVLIDVYHTQVRQGIMDAPER